MRDSFLILKGLGFTKGWVRNSVLGQMKQRFPLPWPLSTRQLVLSFPGKVRREVPGGRGGWCVHVAPVRVSVGVCGPVMEGRPVPGGSHFVP